MPLYANYDVDDIRNHKAVQEVRDNGDGKWRVHANAYGNCLLFHRIVDSEAVRLGNVTTGEEGQLILNVIEI